MKPETLEIPDNVRREIERLQERAERAEAEFNRLDLEVVSQRQARERAEAVLREIADYIDPGGSTRAGLRRKARAYFEEGK